MTKRDELVAKIFVPLVTRVLISGLTVEQACEQVYGKPDAFGRKWQRENEEMDGELRSLFRKYIPHFHWTAIETWPVSHGVPDMNYCAPGGVEGWVEAKKIKGWKILWKPPYLQVAWHIRRTRVGGRTFFAIRRDQALYLVRGCHAKTLLEEGLRGTPWAGSWEGGPAKWNWAEIGLILSGQFTMLQEQDNPQEREDSGCGPSPSPHRAARPK